MEMTTSTERMERNETILRGEDPGPTQLEQAFWWVFPKALAAAVVGAVIGGAVWMAKHDAADAAQKKNTAAQTDHYRDGWITQHQCRRTSYDNNDAVYSCADGEVYKRRDMPVEDK